MSYVAHPETTRHLSDTARHWITAILATLGIVAVAAGSLIQWGPTDGTVTIFGWNWNVSDLHELWAPFLMVGGGILASLPMGIESIRDWGHEVSLWLVTSELVVTLVGIAAIVVGIVLLF